LKDRGSESPPTEEKIGDGIPLIEGTGRSYWSAFPVLTPAGTLFAYAGEAGPVQVWAVQNGENLHEFTHPLEPSDENVDDGDFVCELEFSQDGKLLVSESKARKVRLWDLEHGQWIELLPNDRVTGFRFCGCGQHLVCFGDGEIPYWDITLRKFCEDNTCLYESQKYEIEKRLLLPQECEYVEKPVFSSCGEYLASVVSWNKDLKRHPIWFVGSREW